MTITNNDWNRHQWIKLKTEDPTLARKLWAWVANGRASEITEQAQKYNVDALLLHQVAAAGAYLDHEFEKLPGEWHKFSSEYLATYLGILLRNPESHPKEIGAIQTILALRNGLIEQTGQIY